MFLYSSNKIRTTMPHLSEHSTKIRPKLPIHYKTVLNLGAFPKI